GVERGIELKMSKSKPETAIFMDDSQEDIKTKINNAFCPAKQIESNPILDYAKYLIFEKFNTIKIKRAKKFGGDLEIKNYDDLCNIYQKGKLHPMDLKQSIGEYLNKLMEPVKKKLEKNKTARKLAQEIKTFKLTR
ncbi:unnamed protein product, partial [marine sediment metagenome]